ncbi:hypothetical protein NJB93_21335 [Brucella intermedia]|uniref:hypothetical protein n=1 Tax=Brucella intermedia TaxID=94625 RepID=UPI00209AB453|nr:hypothetical protein [Brucella intermedia]MCO7729091.1 hypothetical protein [Brucella intermedia]
MPIGRVGEGWQAFTRALASPTQSRRIYARRAALAGLLIAATLFLLLLQGQIGISMMIPILIVGLCFAGLFTDQVAGLIALWSRSRFYTSKSAYWLVFPLTFAAFPVLAPIMLAVSAVQFLRSST